jgi:hypothetical protein
LVSVIELVTFNVTTKELCGSKNSRMKVSFEAGVDIYG